MRRQFLTKSRMVISPAPSKLGGRVSSRTTCGCCSCNSAASSQVTVLSPSSMKAVRALSSVVLPEPVPPETRMFRRQAPMTFSNFAPIGVIEPNPTRSSSRSLSFLNFLIVRVAPSIDKGGPITLTRLPSNSRASQIGLASSTRRPTAETIR